MMLHSTLSDDYLWYLILLEIQKKHKRKTKTHANTKILHF